MQKLAEWYYAVGDQSFGPLTATEIQALALAGRLKPTDLVWKTGMPKRVEAKSLKGLFPKGVAATNPPPVPPVDDRMQQGRDKSSGRLGRIFKMLLFAFVVVAVTSSSLLLSGRFPWTTEVTNQTAQKETSQTKSGSDSGKADGKKDHEERLSDLTKSLLPQLEHLLVSQYRFEKHVPSLQEIGERHLMHRRSGSTSLFEFIPVILQIKDMQKYDSIQREYTGQSRWSDDPESVKNMLKLKAGEQLFLSGDSDIEFRPRLPWDMEEWRLSAHENRLALEAIQSSLPKVLSILRFSRSEKLPDAVEAYETEVSDVVAARQAIVDTKRQTEKTLREFEKSRTEMLESFKPGGSRHNLSPEDRKWSMKHFSDPRQQREVADERIARAESRLESAILDEQTARHHLDELRLKIEADARADLEKFIELLNTHSRDLLAVEMFCGPKDHWSVSKQRFDEMLAEFDSLKDDLERGRPKIDSTGLHQLSGLTHLVQGNNYYLDDAVIHIPSKHKQTYITGSAGPNKVGIFGTFRFVENSPGTNGFGAVINVERYEVDEGYLDDLQKQRDFAAFIGSSTGKLARIAKADGKFEPILEVFQEIVGKGVIDELKVKAKAVVDKSDAEKTSSLTSISLPENAAEKSVVPAKDEVTAMPETTEVPMDEPTVRPNSDHVETTPASPPIEPSGTFETDRKLITSFRHVDAAKPENLRWIYGDISEAEKFSKSSYWNSRGNLGYGSVKRINGTTALWRYVIKGSDKYGVSLGQQEKPNRQYGGLLAWVWKNSSDGMIKVSAVENTHGIVQLESDQERVVKLIKDHGWKKRFHFYIYPPE